MNPIYLNASPTLCGSDLSNKFYYTLIKLQLKNYEIKLIIITGIKKDLIFVSR